LVETVITCSFALRTETASARAPEAPVAIFTETASVVPVGTPITFDPSGSYDLDGTIVLYEWDFDGDGVSDGSFAGPIPVTYAYPSPGTYTATLRVTDNDGLTDTASATKTIVPGQVIPEVPLGTIMASAVMIFALVGYFAVPKFRKKQ
jgi:PKD repeat protein